MYVRIINYACDMHICLHAAICAYMCMSRTITALTAQERGSVADRRVGPSRPHLEVPYRCQQWPGGCTACACTYVRTCTHIIMCLGAGVQEPVPCHGDAARGHGEAVLLEGDCGYC